MQIFLTWSQDNCWFVNDDDQLDAHTTLQMVASWISPHHTITLISYNSFKSFFAACLLYIQGVDLNKILWMNSWAVTESELYYKIIVEFTIMNRKSHWKHMHISAPFWKSDWRSVFSYGTFWYDQMWLLYCFKHVVSKMYCYFDALVVFFYIYIYHCENPWSGHFVKYASMLRVRWADWCHSHIWRYNQQLIIWSQAWK